MLKKLKLLFENYFTYEYTLFKRHTYHIVEKAYHMIQGVGGRGYTLYVLFYTYASRVWFFAFFCPF